MGPEGTALPFGVGVFESHVHRQVRSPAREVHGPHLVGFARHPVTLLRRDQRHLRTRYHLTPEQYRERWSLPSDYPMVAPDYAAKRSQLAKSIGLGRKPASSAAPTGNVAASSKAAPQKKPGVRGKARKSKAS